MNKVIEPRGGCIAAALKIIGNKWSGFIIRELTAGPRRFGELQAALDGISPRTLSQRLDSLEAEAVISKKTYAEVPPRVEYALTPKGEEFIPILRAMIAWGDKYSAGQQRRRS